VRLVADILRGLSINEAEAQLSISPQRAAQPLLKLLRSAMANAKNNQQLDAHRLFIKEIRVDQGPMLKRFMPRAMGRATPIQKKTSHITLVLGEGEIKKPRFTIEKTKKISKTKAEKIKKAKQTEKPKVSEKEIPKPAKKAGFMKRIFRRKSIG
jgi:large subunit ribosomal protein L22